MLQSIFDSTTVPLLEKQAIFGERRQEVLAGNIANIDTPGYKMRDLPVAKFQEALQKAIESRRPQPAPSLAGLNELTGTQAPAPTIEQLFSDELFAPTEAPQHDITFQDANNR